MARLRWLVVCVAVVGSALAPGAVGLAAEEEAAAPCAPIAPCTACHNPEATKEKARCLAEPFVAPAAAKELKSPFPTTPKALAFARATYDIYCDGCHGPDGDGLGRMVRLHSVPSINIGAPTVQAQTDGELFWKISNGKGAMPAWGTLLSDEDRWRLVAMVRTFLKK